MPQTVYCRGMQPRPDQPKVPDPPSSVRGLIQLLIGVSFLVVIYFTWLTLHG